MKKRTPRHMIITLLKISDKDNILQGGREKRWITFTGLEKRLRFVIKRRQWHNFFNVLKGKNSNLD